MCMCYIFSLLKVKIKVRVKAEQLTIKGEQHILEKVSKPNN